MTRMLFGVTLAVIALATTASARVHAQGVEGTWRLSYVSNGVLENSYGIIKLQVQDGKTTGELVASRSGTVKTTLKSVTQKGAMLHVTLSVGVTDLIFEAPVPKQAAKRLPGVMEINGTLYPASLTATEDTTLDAKTASRLIDCPPMLQARKASKEEAPKLYREVLDKYADSPAVFDASLNLIRSAKATAANPGDVKAWAAAGANAAKTYGPRMESEFAPQLVGELIKVEGMEKLALEYGRAAEKLLTEKSPAAAQIRVLGVLARALKKAGQENEAKDLDTRVEKLEVVLDKEYAKKMPGFKGTAFDGRKSKSDRAVFMELFTGATCPPCVAADLAFDVLQKTYKKNELVLIQYHMHIPGPDPMTNPDTEARWKYYGKEVRGVPASIFNGKAKAGGGGVAANAESKYNAYRGIIDELIEENAAAKVTAEARRDGDRIEINVKVSDLNEPGADKKLRILLAEETVRYAGSNKIRLHHNVVRAFPGGVDGAALTEAASRHKASISLGELRTSLTKYLDDFEEKGRRFANPARPMSMNHLRVIAFVQDDTTHEILQAVQIAVETK